MTTEHVLPFYVVCDESRSMADHLDALNHGLVELHHKMSEDPIAAERIRLGLIGFSRSAEVLLPLSAPTGMTQMFGLSAQAATSFGAVFTLLRETIELDAERLAETFHVVHRPSVLFLSDGHPTDPVTWSTAFAVLTDPNWPLHPDVIAFGLGDADPATIGRIGTLHAFVSESEADLTAALRALTGALITSAADPDPTVVLRLPDRIAGFVKLPDPAAVAKPRS